MIIARLATAAVLALAAIPTDTTLAQTAADSAGVRAAVLDYVEGLYEGDSTRLVRSVRPDVYKYGFWRHRDSTSYHGSQMTWPAFHAYANRVKARGSGAPPNAPKVIELFDVQDQTASAKLTAWWGIDYLLLAKYDGRWMITHVLWQSPPRVAAKK
ncbi:MAG: nuclear transport factor 2 family protein [Gemmatimonadaceae bacterium]